MITLMELARELNVSVATVSNAVSGKGRMREEKRREIIEAAVSRGYDFSRVLERGRKKNICVIVEQAGVRFSDEIITGICMVAEQINTVVSIYNLNILAREADFNTHNDSLKASIQRVLNVIGATTGGIIYVSQYPRDLTKVLPQLPYPFVCAYCYTTNDYPCVNYDDAQGAYIATQHLAKTGCRRIAMISGPINSIPMTKRLNGYQRALIDYGLPFDPQLIQLGEWSFDSGYTCTNTLLNLDQRPDAVFCQSDHIAVGAMRAVRAMQLRIPDDIAIVGFDNYDFCLVTDPLLTTIAPPCIEIGQRACELLLDILNRRPIGSRNIKIDCQLVERASTRPLPQHR